MRSLRISLMMTRMVEMTERMVRKKRRMKERTTK